MSVRMEKPTAQDRSVVLCQSDGAQSVNRSFAHQIQEMSHTSTHKATLQDQTTVMWLQQVSLVSLPLLTGSVYVIQFQAKNI